MDYALYIIYYDTQSLICHIFIGETTNRLLNDSWKEVINEVGPPVADSLKTAFRSTIQKFLDSVSVDELLLP